MDCQVLTAERQTIDLTRQVEVERWLAAERPQAVFLAAAKVGGIVANDRAPVEFLYNNLAIALNVIHASAANGVEKLLFLGSSCIYPKFAPQPMAESCLLTGPLEPTNEAYAIAKIAGIKLCAAYRRQYGSNFMSVMPTNLYGPGDNYDLQNAHVVPALIRKMHEAKLAGSKEVMIWGTGTPKREFLISDDMADACVYLMERHDAGDLDEFINVGTGEDLTVAELAKLVATTVGFKGQLTFDRTKPDGTPRKLLDVRKLHALGWRHRIALDEGLRLTYADFQQNSGRI